MNGQLWTESLCLDNHAGTVQPLFHIDMFLTLAGRDAAGKYRVLVGDPKMAAQTLGVAVWPHPMQEVFDNIANHLTNAGVAVRPGPCDL